MVHLAPELRATASDVLACSEPVSVAEYHELIDSGRLTENRRVELIEGVLTRVCAYSPEHVHAVATLNRILVRALGDEWIVLPGGPLTLARSEPEPDIVVVRAEVAQAAQRNPTTASLVIEVANTSLALDRQLASLYAEAGVPDYWIIDCEHRQVEVFRIDGHAIVAPPADLRPLELPRVVIPVADLFR